jgi:hypothetical protein
MNGRIFSAALIPLALQWRCAALVLSSMLLLNLTHMTEPVRLANSDDAKFQAALSQPNKEKLNELFTDWSQRQGRFYFASPSYGLPYAIYVIRNPFLFSLSRAIIVYAQFILLGWLVARLCNDEAVGWLVVLISGGAMHIPAIFYPILSYPAYSAGSIALLLALHSFLSNLKSTQIKWMLGSCVLYLFALLWHENFLIFVLLFPALCWATTSRLTLAEIIQRSLPILCVAGIYLCTYIGFRHLFPPIYDGTVTSFDLAGVVNAWTRQTFAALPGVELLINRAASYPNVGPLWKNSVALAATLHSVSLTGFALAICGGLLAVALARRTTATCVPTLKTISFLLFAAALPNILPSLTEKYQMTAYHRLYPYVYSFNSYYWGIAGATILLVFILGRPNISLWASRGRLLLTLLLMWAIFISAQASNQYTLNLLSRWYN